MGWQDAHGPKTGSLTTIQRSARDDHMAHHSTFALGHERKRRHPRRIGAQRADESNLNGLVAGARLRREGAAMDFGYRPNVSEALPADEHGRHPGKSWR